MNISAGNRQGKGAILKDFKQYLMDDGYFRQEELIFADCDRNQRARVSTFLSKAAAFAGYDYDARGLTHEKLYSMREVFLLSRMAVRIHRCPMAREVLDISTWENGVKGAHMQRVYELADQTGAVCVSIRSEWILVDPETRHIMRPETFTAKKLGVCTKPIDCPEPKKVLLPKEGREDRGSRMIRWSDLDGNGHVYSGNYGDIVWDALPEDLQERVPTEFYINYSKEATLGQELKLWGFRDGQEYRMEGIGPQGTCFTASCVFADQ